MLKKFLKKTVLQNRRTKLALAFFFFVFLVLPSAKLHAATVYEAGPSGSSVNVNFASCSPLPGCRSDQLYVTRGENLPVNVTFDRVRIFTGSATTTPRLYLYVPLDTGSPRTSCVDGGCVNDDTYGSQLAISSTNNVGGGVWEFVFTTPYNVGGSGRYFYISFDPNPTYTNFGKIFLSSQGQKENGLNAARTSGGYQYQLCMSSCGAVGAWSSVSQLQYLDAFKTKFVSGTVTGASRTTVTFNLTYFLEVSEFTVGNRPDFVNITVVKDLLGSSDTQLVSQNNFILPLTQGTTTKNILVDTSHPNGDYVAYVTFWNVQNNNVTFAKTSLTFKYTVTNAGVTTYSQVAVTNSTTNESSDYEQCSSVLDVACGIRNSMKYLFVPSTESVAAFVNLKDTVMTKAPFIYVSQTSDIFKTIFQGRTGVVPTISVPFMASSVVLISQSQITALPYVSTIRSLVAMGIYLTLLYGLYRMALRIHDNVTPA